MPKDKNYKKMVKAAFEDKVNNTIMMMKFLHSKGGLELVREYFGEAIPSYLLEFAGLGDAQKWVLRQLAKTSPHAFMKQVGEKSRKEGQYMTPLENYEVLEDTKEQIRARIKCRLIKNLVKQGNKFQCDFDVRDYYCNNACIPLLSKAYSDICLNIKVDLNEDGCVQTVQVDKQALKGEEKKESTD